MNTTNLATFVAVMQTGSISSAAEKLYITQPAVSKRIKNLEDEFGTALFDTVGRSISQRLLHMIYYPLYGGGWMTMKPAKQACNMPKKLLLVD